MSLLYPRLLDKTQPILLGNGDVEAEPGEGSRRTRDGTLSGCRLALAAKD